MRRDRGRKPRRKVCVFCADHIDQIDYKDVAKLRRFTTERGKILPRRISGTAVWLEDIVFDISISSLVVVFF